MCYFACLFIYLFILLLFFEEVVKKSIPYFIRIIQKFDEFLLKSVKNIPYSENPAKYIIIEKNGVRNFIKQKYMDDYKKEKNKLGIISRTVDFMRFICVMSSDDNEQKNKSWVKEFLILFLFC
jgi:hypothetical protein